MKRNLTMIDLAVLVLNATGAWQASAGMNVLSEIMVVASREAVDGRRLTVTRQVERMNDAKKQFSTSSQCRLVRLLQ